MINKILNKKSFLFLFLILCFSLPRTVQIYKYLLLFILVSYLVSYLSKDSKLNKSYLTYVFILTGLFIIPLLIGVFYNNEGEFIFSSLKTNVLFPVLIFTILQCFKKVEILEIIKKSSRISILVISILLLSTVLYTFNIFPINFNEFFYPAETNARITGGYFHFINSSLSYLIFIIPIVFVPLKKNKTQFLFFFLLLLMIVFTGRRILILPFLIIFIFDFKRFIVPLLFLLTFLTFVKTDKIIDKEIVVERFSDAINSTGDSSVRGEQSKYFEKNIIEKPFFGYGLGSYMKEYIRNNEFKTAYERSFHYQLFSLGVPTTLMLWGFYLFMIIRVYTKNKSYVGFLLGITSLLLSSYTNPYWLSSFDYCIPLAILMRFAQNEKNIES